jgi:DHA1 family bicyclomycin/chloramphenicol resistance-like MFS transporter
MPRALAYAEIVGACRPVLSRGQVALLAVLGLVGTSAISALLPSLPSIAADLTAASGREGLVLTLYLAGLATGQLVWGPASDRWGRRRMMLLGLMLYLGGSFACAFAPSIEWLIGCRLVQALGACAGLVLGRAIVRDLYTGNELGRMLALLAAALGAAPLMGPVVGGLIEVWLGWRAIFGVFTGAGVVLAVAVWAYLPETLQGRDATLTPAGAAGPMTALLTDRRFLLAVLATGFLYSSVYIYQAGAPRMFIDGPWQMSPDVYGCLGFATAAGYVGVTWLLARRATFRAARLAALGGLLVASGSLAFLCEISSGIQSLWIILPTVVFMSIGMGCSVPALGALALAGHARVAGSASALLGCVTMAMGGGATLLLAVVGAGNNIVMAGLVWGAACLGAIMSGTLARTVAAARA